MTIEIKQIGDERKGKQWTRKITGVDPSKTNGYAFEGEFLREGENELNEGDVILQVGEFGSHKHHSPYARVSVVDNGKLRQVPAEDDSDGDFNYRTKFVSLRQTVSDLLGRDVNPMAEFTDEQIRNEAIRRGIITE